MEIRAQAQGTIAQVTALVVKTPDARQLAADLWDAIRAFRKQTEAEKETVCRPLKTAWDDAKVPYDEFIKECQGHESALQKKMGEWDREQERLAQEEQARLQAKIDKQNEKAIAKAEEKGVEPVLKVAPVVQAPPKSIETQAGTKQVRQTVKKWTISGLTPEQVAKLPASDPRLKDVPRECLIVDPVKVNALVKVGLQPGCVAIHEEYVYSQR